MVKIKMHGREYPLCMTLNAIIKINDKIGGIDNIYKEINDANMNGRIETIVYLVTLFINEAAAQHNVFEPQEEKWPTVTEEQVLLGAQLKDIGKWTKAIGETIAEGYKTSIESEKN